MAMTRSYSRKVPTTKRATPLQEVNFHTPQKKRSSSSSRFNAASSAARNPRRGKKMTRAARQQILSSHPWVVPGSVRPHSVVCAGCDSEIQLDNRGAFYCGFWFKHTRRCRTILISNLEDRGYTHSEAVDYLRSQKRERLEAYRAAREQETELRSEPFDDADDEESMDSESTLSDESIASPETSQVALPRLGRKELHLNPTSDITMKNSSLDMLAQAAFLALHENMAAVNIGDNSV